ncbi:ATP-binding protein [Streptococcus parasanguinis]|uniref:AAA family ATPase n=1 Tax=Streptococcus parasanguinis TaxID=1318 RepID=UPI001CBBE852|nr:AAA family ATPase [Streptococcus parasanguinis]MBZ2090703.1 ATP-binding protein [Streptococcus parasanguinis]
MKLLGLIIRNYENIIVNQIFNFSDEYTICYNWGDTIEIKKNLNCIPNFYGKNITNISAIVGINGVGKTSLLNFIGFKLSERKEFLNKYEYFLIYESNEDIFIEFNNSLNINKILFQDTSIEIESGLLGFNDARLFKKQDNYVETYNFTSDGSINYIFKRYDQYSFDEPNDGVDKIIENKLILRNLCQSPTNYYRILAFKFLKTNDFFTPNKKMNYRISFWSINSLLQFMIEVQIKFPQELLGQLQYLDNDNKDEYTQFTKQIIDYFIYLIYILNSNYNFDNKNLLNLIYNIIKDHLDSYNINSLTEHDNFIAKLQSNKEILLDYFVKETTGIDKKNNYQISDFIRFSIETIQKLYLASKKEDSHIEFNNNSFIIDVSIENKEINDFLNSYNKLIYCNNTNKGEVIFTESNLFLNLHKLSSTGEENLVVLIASLITLISEETKGNKIILIDEVDETFHPSWSTKIIQLLSVCCTYFRVFFGLPIKETSFQFIITTHSPYILSDIKNQNVLSLEYDQGKIISKQVNTFSKNIQRITYDEMTTHNIYGSFAEYKINKIVNILNQNYITPDLLETIRDEIQIINEGIIRNKLNQMLLEISPSENKVDLLISKLSSDEIALLKSKLE